MPEGLPVKGYKSQSDAAVTAVNEHKIEEERLLRRIELLFADETLGADKRWLAIAKTLIEQGFMALNRAVFKPGRVELPEDIDHE